MLAKLIYEEIQDLGWWLPVGLFGLIVLAHVVPYIRNEHDLNKYPGPFWAKFTDLWLALQARKGSRYKVIDELHKKYGPYVRIAPNHLSIADPDAINPVYGHATGTLKSNFYDAFVANARGLFNTRDRAQHSRKRKIVSHVFAKSSVVEFEPYIAQTVARFLKKWDGICEKARKDGREGGWSEPFDTLPWFNFLAFDIIGDLAFGEPFRMVEREADIADVEDESGKVSHLSAVQILNERGEYSATLGVIMPWLRPYLKYVDPWFARGQTSVNNLTGIARNRVNKRLKEGASDRKDLLARLQEARDDEGKPMELQELTAEALTQLIAGSDTTSNSSCAISFWIAKYPKVQEKLAAELREALQGRDIETSPVVDYDEVKGLPYLAAVINEALRHHSTSALGLPRIIPQDAVFKGEAIHAGTIASVPAYTIHHQAKTWGPNASEFDPERWFGEGADVREKAFVPFSYGPRSCVGRNLATMELFVFIATLFARYEFKLADPNLPELPSVEGFLRKPTENWMSIRRRVYN